MAPYTSGFYAEQRQGSRHSAEVIVPLVMELVRPRSVIDVGCGVGTWLAVFEQHGVEDIVGLDGDYVDRSKLAIPPSCFRAEDLSRRLVPDRVYDLACSLEVAEHLPASRSDSFVSDLTAMSSVVLFSAAIPGQGGTGHVNEQWPDYWSRRFTDRGYRVVDVLRPAAWMHSSVASEYAQNAMLFVRHDVYERDGWDERVNGLPTLSGLNVVHPGLYDAKEAGPDPKSLHLRGNLRLALAGLRTTTRALGAVPSAAIVAVRRRRGQARGRPD